MKRRGGIVVAVVTALLLTVACRGDFKHPEDAILGSWKEVSWTYEIVDAKAVRKDRTLIEPNPSLEHDAFSELIIHRSEQWHFRPNAALVLDKKHGKHVRVRWNLKGRGHILKLSYSDNITEYYQVRELTDKRMILHFENDVHAKGIVRIVFTKNALRETR